MARKEDTVSLVDLQRLLVNSLRSINKYQGIKEYVPWGPQIDFHQSKAKGKMLMGGNRLGKTVAGAAEAVMRLTGLHERNDLPKPPIRGRAVAVDVDRGIKLILIPEIKKWMPEEFLINGKWEDSYNKTEKILTLNNGSTMEFMSYEQEWEKFAGTSRHFVWFDEEPPESIFKECCVRLIDTDGDWWMTMTPLIEMSWSYSTLYEPTVNGHIDWIEIFTGDTTDNPHVKEEAFTRLTSIMSDEEKKTRKTGVYISHTGLVYGESFSRSRNVIPDITKSERFSILRTEWSHFQTMDHGYNNPTAILFAAYDNDGRIIIYDEIYKNKTIIRDLAAMWHERRAALEITTQYVVGDPSIQSKSAITGTSVQSEYAEQGIYIGLGNNDLHGGLSLCQRYFADQSLIITSRCKNLLSELFKYRWDRHLTKAKDRKNLKEEPVKKDDHACDAMRYGVMSRPRHYENVDTLPWREFDAVSPASDYDMELGQKDQGYIDQFLGSEV